MSTTVLQAPPADRLQPRREAGVDPGAGETLVVGVAVAANDLDCLASLFGNLSPNQNVAYVVVQYKQLNCAGNVLDFLTRHSRLEVEEPSNGAWLRPNHIYLLPPNSPMRLEGGRLLAKQEPSMGLRHPVDDFFISLAEEMHEKSIAVLLSGTGTDGIRGLRAVKGMGGLTIARALDSARFCGEAQGTVTSRLCDMELSPGMISVEITNYLKNIEAAVTGAQGDYDEEEVLAQIYSLLKKVSSIDFTYYKKDTFRRRISRRMTLHHTSSLQAYLALAMSNEEEVRALGKDILIGSTKFFRDAPCFTALKNKVLTELIKQSAPDESIRVWVAGCSTGEEAYSVAILFDECMREMDKTPSVEIFATDIHSENIQTASRGVYHESIAADVLPTRLNRYFTHKGSHYTVCKAIRRMCVFAPHNLFINPPFRALDLILYRNVHIYLQPILQNVILTAFHSVLKPGGFLFMGRSESVGEHGDVFTPFSIAHKIFRYAPPALPQAAQTDGAQSSSSTSPVSNPVINPAASPASRPASPCEPLAKLSARILPQQHEQALADERARFSLEDILPQVLESLSVISVLISDTDEIEHLSGMFQDILQLPCGLASRHLFKLLTPELCQPVSSLIRSARQEARPASFANVRLENGTLFNLSAIPLKTGKGQPLPLLALLFEPVKGGLLPLENAPSYAPDSAARQRINELEQDVRELRESLEYNLAELKALNQELQSSNQEMLISNEELQTSNEELQSVNEELFIVNSEYQLKLTELMELNDDMSNFLNSTMIGLLLVDSHLNVRKFTDYVAREFGLMDHDIGRSMMLVMKHFTNIDIVEITQRVLQNLTTVQCEARSTDNKHYMLRVSPYRTAESKINGLVISLVDIEELKGAYNQIEKLSYAIEQMPNIVVLTDPQGRVDYVNPRFSSLTGYAAEEMQGKSLRDCLSSSLSDQEYAEIWDKLQHQEIWTAEMECCKKNGETYWERISLLPVVNKESQITNYLKLAEDITSQKLMQLSEVEYRQHLERMVSLRTAALEESRNEAQAASIAKTEFLSTMSHEIRTPMNAIIGFTHIFDRSNLSPAQLRHLDKIQLSANTLLAIINDVLDIAKIESGKLELHITAFDLRRAVETVCSIVDNAATAKGLSLHVQVHEAVPAILLGDGLRINQILLNLLNNAIKFTEKGSVSLEVSLIRGPGPGSGFESPGGIGSNPPDAELGVELGFAVEDTGIGMSEEQLPRIFQSFMQADNSISRKYGGTGLGLSICRQLVERMGGQLSVQSSLGKGSCFRFNLPLLLAQPCELGSPTEQSCIPASLDSVQSLRGRRVLVVEDNEINQEIALALLGEYEMEVHSALNGRDAVAMASSNHYDCIFMDVQMPVMNGLEATRHLREMASEPGSQWLAYVPIIAMTANVMAEDKEHCLQAGMNAHMVKPIEPEVLKAMLHRWILGRTDTL